MSQPRSPQAQDLFTGIFIPRAVLEDGRLTAPARILFGCLDGLGRSEKGCYASSSYLARILGVKPRQVRNLIKTLEALGYVSRQVTKRNQRTIFTVTAKALQTVKAGGGGRQQIAEGVGNRLPHILIKDKDNPPTPLKGGGRRSRNRKALKGEDYANGF